jgi:hypothetical protein
MELFMTFIYILAWIGAVGGTIAWFLCGCAAYKYNYGGPRGGPSLQKTLHQVKGIKVTWPTGKYLLIAVLSWCWIVATYLQ